MTGYNFMHGSNFCILAVGHNRLLISYNEPVAMVKDGMMFQTARKFSVTTSKHISSNGYKEALRVSEEEWKVMVDSFFGK